MYAFKALCVRCFLWVGVGCMALPAWAAEGTTAAGPIGGTDIRSAMLPPPGLYGGLVGLYSSVNEVRDGSGNPVAGLDAVDLNAKIAGAFLAYVPDFKLFGGSVGLVGFFTGGQECGQLVSTIPSRCVSGFGDPYVEADWSRSFGQLRPSRDPGAFPIMEGLTVNLGLGAVIPVGQYDANLQTTNGISIGNKTFDLAPSVAFTYTTPPLIAEGTEFSTKIYWNDYGTNPVTDYTPGSLIDVDFAISEHIGRWQVGPAGVYLKEIADDQQYGVVVPPDGRRLEYLAVGGVVNYDIAEMGAAIKAKVLTTVLAQNSGVSKVFVIGIAKKLY
jgi:hypothetical protein